MNIRLAFTNAQISFLKFRLRMRALCHAPGYRFRHWAFQWKIDEEHDLVLSVFNLVHFVKYKEHAVIRWGWQNFADAPRHLKIKSDGK